MILRFAPSPTGFLHLANARIALLNLIKSKQIKGKFILRLDDTDVERSKDEYVDQILNDMKWFGIEFAEIVKQSDRFDIYNAYVEKLKALNIIYPAYETEAELKELREKQIAMKQAPRYKQTVLDTTRTPHWRFKLPEMPISWNDEIMGSIHFASLEASDPVVIREDGTYTYILASLIDDYEMNITHIVRGRDHLPNTAVQLQMLSVLNEMNNTSKTFQFSHFPLISSLSGQVFSKRDGAFALKTIMHQGLDMNVVARFLLNLGMSTALPDMPLSKMHEYVLWQLYGKSDIKCDPEQLISWNKVHISRLNAQEGLAWIQNIMQFGDQTKEWLDSVTNMISQTDLWEKRWSVLKFCISNANECYVWSKVLAGHYNKIEKDEYLETVKQIVEQSQDWEQICLELKQKYPNKNIKELLAPIRMCLIGMEHGPKMHELFMLFDKDEILTRLS